MKTKVASGEWRVASAEVASENQNGFVVLSPNGVPDKSLGWKPQVSAGPRFRVLFHLAVLVLLATGLWPLTSPAHAAEIASNGAGGGPWSDPTSWAGKTVPTADDDVVIQKGDLIVFDRDDDGKTTCQKLFIDPRAALHFESAKGKRTLCLGDAVESYGAIKMDGSRSADDLLELRLVGNGQAKRGVKLLKGAAWLVSGRAGLPGGSHNVRIACPRNDKKEALPGQLETTAGVMLDIQKADLDDFYVRAFDIDNTGSKPNERLNFVDNKLTGFARIFCQKCDTPVIVRNRLDLLSDKPLPGELRAVHVSECPLAEIRGNTVHGPYQFGIAVSHGSDTSVSDNTVEGSLIGLHLGFGANHMLKGNTARGCETGLDIFYPGTAVIEDTTVEGAKRAVFFRHGSVQLTGLHIDRLAKDGVGVRYEEAGLLALVNCNVAAAQVEIANLKPLQDKEQTARVVAMYYLVAAAKGAPPDAQVDVKTVNPTPPLPPNAVDLNIRNAPAAVTDGLTPLPQSLGALIVKGWSVDVEGKPVAAPEYDLRLLAPLDKPGAERKVLGALKVKPQDSWYRVKPNEPTPTPEVVFK